MSSLIIYANRLEKNVVLWNWITKCDTSIFVIKVEAKLEAIGFG